MDDGSIPRYIVLIICLLAGGAYFASAETAFASVSRIRMISCADDGDKRAKKALYILDNFDEALITLLIGNNIVQIACASISTLLASKLWGNAAVTASTFIMTFVVFIFAEMIPKSYAKACNEKVALAIAKSLVMMMKLFTPISFIFSGMSKLTRKAIVSKPEEEPTVTEEELYDVIENIDEEDEIDEDTTELVQSALEFTTTRVKDILTPWENVVTLRLGMTPDEVFNIVNDLHYSRLPVVDGHGKIVGVLQVRKFLKAKIVKQGKVVLRTMLDKVQYVAASMPIDDLLSTMSGSKTHLAVARDADENIIGIVTVEDILEELVGEIYDEEDTGGEVR